ncbi:MAG: hypothetical protein Unbinned3891contig1000_12 [Prokaryotic dsDNA virus sp.]|nr:MAG: hypothetical protein Unbinned3891contig1000_12 [Prokaryotic dsDNA virus sp.]|tara:strand:- start:19753 stop:20259 length:507 start_codon:yes stop_codon:yes gene_type:complete
MKHITTLAIASLLVVGCGTPGTKSGKVDWEVTGDWKVLQEPPIPPKIVYVGPAPKMEPISLAAFNSRAVTVAGWAGPFERAIGRTTYTQFLITNDIPDGEVWVSKDLEDWMVFPVTGENGMRNMINIYRTNNQTNLITDLPARGPVELNLHGWGSESQNWFFGFQSND